MSALEPGSTALVTGASAGIGRAFALALAERGLDVVLVARDEARLKEVGAGIEGMGRRAEVLRADLADADERARVEARLRAAPLIALLVNNAAMGRSGPFAALPVEAAVRQIEVNVVAPTRLFHAAITAMTERGRGGIINLSSGAQFFPSLRNATYSATKAYLGTLSIAVGEEARGAGLGVLTVFPGFTRTEFQARAGFDVSRVPALFWQEAADVARESLAAFERGQTFCVPGVPNRLAFALHHLVPYRLTGRLAALAARLTPQPRDP